MMLQTLMPHMPAFFITSKRLAHEVPDTHATYASLLHNIKDADHQTQNCSIHHCVSASLRTSISMITNQHKNCCESTFYSTANK